MTTSTTETRQLGDLLAGIDCTVTGDIAQTEITGLSLDSRSIQPGNLFAAIRGLTVDGHRFVDQAVAAGCSALMVNRGWQDSTTDKKAAAGVPLIEVDDTRTALGRISAAFYDQPDRECTLIGITGTNGKTTTSFLLEGLLKACGKRPGVIGTVNYRYNNRNGTYIEMDAPFTTPESPILFRLLREMADEGITDIIMEVSSHALAQKRLTGMGFDIAVFTNLSRDHLDFHSDMDHYFSSKKLLFTDYLKPDGRVVIMLAESPPPTGNTLPPMEHVRDWGRKLREELNSLYHLRQDSHDIVTCGFSCECDVHPHNSNMDINGIEAEIVTPAGRLSIVTPLVGAFNLRNLLCAIGTGISHGDDLSCIRQGLEKVVSIPGRLEKISPEGTAQSSPAVFVDYAHTPDALENVLDALTKLGPKRLICVFGCGGDRDQGKRELMGEIAGRLSDVVLATSDNPRSEPPERILSQIEAGLEQSPLKRVTAGKLSEEDENKGYDIIVSRKTAIATAIGLAGPGDIILVSGKGHENYQLSRSGKVFFSDRIEAEMQLKAAAGLEHIWKLDWLRQTTGGRLLRPADGQAVFSGISTDSRSIKPGELFIALRGENFDGRKFTEKAIANGAAGLLINQADDPEQTPLDFEPSVPTLVVSDTLYSLGQLASSRRSWNHELQVLAVTGSSGKTTVKEMTGAILGLHHSILKTEGNLNNLVGLPLTLLKLKNDHQYAVLEMGMNRPGEISRLTEIADPDIACIVNVQEAHLEGLGDIHGVARAKNELFVGLKPGAKAAINLDDEIVRSLAAELDREKITFGFSPDAFVRATDIESLGPEGSAYTLHIGDECSRIRITAIGRHNISNSLAAAALAYCAGMDFKVIAEGLAAFTPYEKRSCVEKLPAGILVLNDCYNANPSSMLAALTTLHDLKNGHRAVAILGDMLELGTQSDSAHEAIGKKVFELDIDYLAVFGSQAPKMIAGARKAGMANGSAKGFNTKNELVHWLGQLIQDGAIKAGDWLLVKGSRGMHMEEVLELLRKEKI